MHGHEFCSMPTEGPKGPKEVQDEGANLRLIRFTSEREGALPPPSFLVIEVAVECGFRLALWYPANLKSLPRQNSSLELVTSIILRLKNRSIRMIQQRLRHF